MNLVETSSGGELLGFYSQYDATPPVCLRPAPSESGIKRKQSHNAYERDRRKKINTLYTCLRSLLPQSENNKKLSIPNTVAKVLDYVPDLQRQVERLERRKEEIIARTRSCQDLDGRSSGGGYPLVSVADLGSGEAAIQICALSMAGRKGMMSAVMEYLDSEGLFTVHASTLAVDSSRILLSLHCQLRNASVTLDPGKLRIKLSAMQR